MKKYITKQSDIKGAGKGLFTKAAFKKGEVIGLAHVDDQPYSEIGHNHNHKEENPTAFSKKIDNKRYIFASRDLKPGEEITTNYRLQPELEQPEDFEKKKGGMVSLPKDKPEKSKKFSRSLDATNRLYTENNLFKKPKSRRNKVFDPHAKYYAEGGTYEEAELTPEEIEAYRAEGYTVDDNEYQDGDNTDAMNGMMKARLAYANEFGNPAAKRMINLPDTPYQFDNGDTGTHYMASMDNYAVPQIQDENGVLQLGDYGPESNEAIRFDSDEDANYFAENYKNVSPGFINEKKEGGLHKFVGGGPTDCPEGAEWDDQIQSCICINGMVWEAAENRCVKVQAFPSVKIDQYTPYVNAWNEMHPEQAEMEQKKYEYLRKAPGLNRALGVTKDNLNEKVLRNIAREVDRERNNYVITQYAKDQKFNPNDHVQLVENIAERGQGSYDMAQNSQYGSKLAPSLWARTAAGFQELGNFIVKQLPGEQGDVFKYKVPGLSKKERKQIADSKTGALEATSIINLPGQIIANQVAKYVKPIFGGTGADARDQEDTPGVLSGQYIPGVDDKAATLLNPLTYTGLTSGLIGGPNVLKTALPIAKNVFNKTLDAADYVNKLSLNKLKNLITTPKINYLNKPSVFKDVVNNAELGQVLAVNGLTNAALDSKDNINDIISGNTNKNTYKDLGFNILNGVISGSKFSPLSNLGAVKNFRNSYGLADSGYKAATGTDNLKDDFSLIKSLGLFKRKEGGPNNNYMSNGSLHRFVKGGPTDCPKDYEWNNTTQKCELIAMPSAPINPNEKPITTYQFESMTPDQILARDAENLTKEQENWTNAQWLAFDKSNKVKDEVESKVKAEEAYNKALVNEPQYADEAMNFVKGWHDSPMYNQMVLNSYNGQKKNADYLTKLRKQNIATIPAINIIANQEAAIGTGLESSNVAALSRSDTGQVEVFPAGFEYGPSLYTHEYIHSSDRPRELFDFFHPSYANGKAPDWMSYSDKRFPDEEVVWHNRVMPKSDQMYISTHRSSNWKDNENYKLEKEEGKYVPKTDEELKQEVINSGVSLDDPLFKEKFNAAKKQNIEDIKWSQNWNKKQWKTLGHNYVSIPTEVRARLGEIRLQAKKENIYDPYTEQITPEIFQNYINKKREDSNFAPMKPIDELRNEFTDEEILYMLQNISKNPNPQKEEEGAEGIMKYGGGIEMELTPEEIEEYRRGGFTVEEIY